MKRLILQGPARRLFTRIHRWSGLTVFTLLFVAGATGAVLTFRQDIERWVNPHLRVVTPTGRYAPLQVIIDRVEQRFQNARVSTITLPARPDDSLVVYLGKRPGSPGELEASEVFANPYTADILGFRDRRQPVYSRDNVVPMLVRLHYSLLLGSAGVWVMGIAAIVWLLTTLIGLALAWPAAWHRVKSWRPILSVRREEGSHKLNYDLHRALGVALAPFWVVLAFSSVYLNFPNLVRAATGAVSTLSTPPSRSSPPIERPNASPDDAIAAALARVQGAHAFGVTRDFTKGWYSVRLVTRGDVNPSGNSQAYVDFNSGQVLSVRLASAASPGTRFLYWQFPLHSGEAFGLPGRLAVTVAALALMVMCGTGVYLWWRGWILRLQQVRTRTNEGARHAETT
ncbi:MAG: PepSY-associated TM helix domain-containing protein [Vicinamibacterales bacterium]